MSNQILRDTLTHLRSRSDPLKARVTELHLTRYFTIAELDDGSVGACMSYYTLSDSVLSQAEHEIATLIGDDPYVLLDTPRVEGTLRECVESDEQRRHLMHSLMATLTSALSATFIRRGGDQTFRVARNRPLGWVDGVTTALVVGFGGFFSALVAEENIRRVHVIDLEYSRRQREIDAQIAFYRHRYYDKTMIASSSLTSTSEFQDFDLVSITGSTLCNGTLEQILASVRKDAVVILQGQSASVHPKLLFESGVAWVATTIKPRAVSRLACGDHDGRGLRRLLEGGLPWIYLLPRRTEDRTTTRTATPDSTPKAGTLASQRSTGYGHRPRLRHEVTTQFLAMENYREHPNSPRLDSLRRVVVISTDRIGDSLNCIYFLSNLRVLHPHAAIIYIGREFGDRAFVRTLMAQYADSTLFLERLSERALEQLGADVIFDLNPSARLFPFYPKMPCIRVGHHEKCDFVVPQRGNNCKSNEHLNILRCMGKTAHFRYPAMVLPTFSDGRSALEQSGCPYIVLCLEATAVAWMIKDDVAHQLIDYLLATTKFVVYIVGSNINGHGFRYRGCSGRVRNLTGTLSLSQAICLLAGARFVISVDTGLMHAASYLGSPLLAVFTCGNPARNGPQGQLGRTVVVRILVDPPTGRWEKDDLKQSGIERFYLRLDHLVEGLASLYSTKSTTIDARVTRTTDLERFYCGWARM